MRLGRTYSKIRSDDEDSVGSEALGAKRYRSSINTNVEKIPNLLRFQLLKHFGGSVSPQKGGYNFGPPQARKK